MMLECAEGKAFKYSVVIFALDRISHHEFEIDGIAGTSLVVEDGSVEFFLGREVTKHHCFRNARSLRNLLGCRAAKAFAGKHAHGYAQDLRASLVAGHSRPRECRANVLKSGGFFRHKYSLPALRAAK